jgi:hypothetical protein
VSAAVQTHAYFETYPALSTEVCQASVLSRPVALPPAMGIAMRQFDYISHSEDIVHPTCAKCGAPMWLTRIGPDEPNSEKRTFECQACQNEAIEVVKFR